MMIVWLALSRDTKVMLLKFYKGLADHLQRSNLETSAHRREAHLDIARKERVGLKTARCGRLRQPCLTI